MSSRMRAFRLRKNQEREVVLMMEDRRQASEDLFGNLVDFERVQHRVRMQIVCVLKLNGCARSF